jgi:murein L,D-transpeptidase YcbB/YkuD
MSLPRFGRHLSLALFCVALAACGDSSGGGIAAGPQSVDSRTLRAQADGPRTRAFYEARGWTAAWDDRSAGQVQAAIGKAVAHGLRPDMFLKSLPDDPTGRELALTRAALTYASALARGHVDPKGFGLIYTIPRPNPDLAAGLAQALERGDVGQWLESLAPQSDEYRALSRAYLQYRQRAAQVRHIEVGGGGLIRPGRRDPRIPAVAAALRANDYLPPEQSEPPADPRRYSEPLVQAVQRLQADRGLKPDGIIGPATLVALNRGPADRARQFAVGLERLRWTERDPPPRRIDVNTAATFLDYYRDGQPAVRRRVVVGEPEWNTPQLQSPIYRLVAHPIWRIPKSIYADELVGKSAAYYRANHMAYRGGRLVQLPGPKNALGQLKFDMRNDDSIYLHDTPAKALFTEAERHRSHGCIRVEGSLDFAMMLAAEDGAEFDLQQALANGEETFVPLKREIPVRLLYRTAFLDGGTVRLVPDIYGWDDPIARALGLGAGLPRRPHVHRRGADVGP